MTAREAEQKVRERYPDAVCKRYTGDWRVRSLFRASVQNEWLGDYASKRADAWKSAARRLTGE